VDFLAAYRNCVADIEKDIAAGDWPGAERRLNEFLCNQDDMPEADPLLTALRKGREVQPILQARISARAKLTQMRSAGHTDLDHPFLEAFRRQRKDLEVQVIAPIRLRYSNMSKAAAAFVARQGDPQPAATLRAWLTTPVLGNPARIDALKRFANPEDEPPAAQLAQAEHALLHAAGPNRTALLAAIGDVSGVVDDLKRQCDFLPHNLGVAVLAELEQCQDRKAEHLGLLLGSAALFACCDAYRAEVARRLGGTLPAGLDRDDRSVPARVRAELEKLFRQARLSWGEPTEPGSWAGRWEAECLAVNRLSEGKRDPQMPWPFGPALVDFYDLGEKLRDLLSKSKAAAKLRRCYGPLAQGEALVWAGNPEGADRVLPRVEDCTQAMADAAPGYRHLADSLDTLRKDAACTHANVWFNLLFRYQFGPDTAPAESDRISQGIVDCCRELLRLETETTEIEERLPGVLRQLFARLADHLDRPEVFLNREITVEDGEARKKCLDLVLLFLEEVQPAPWWLTNLLPALRLSRAGLLVHLADLKFAWWRDHGRNNQHLEEMLLLADLAVRDAPNLAHPAIKRAEILMLMSCMSRGEKSATLHDQAVAYLHELRNRAILFRWSGGAVHYVHELIELASSAGSFEVWIRRLAAKDR
jgi:hypothetical protein